ncbi:bacterial type II/III secretion system short domain-containing protein [Ditylenchus destructor]|nr:bacterial type II/III secretion system short domain-containing protein [Ditylenchus destructor]
MLAASAGASAMPWGQGAQPVVLTAREQPLGAFLEGVFSQADSPVSLSPNLSGQVSGRFRMSAQTLVQEMARAYSLVVFHDGMVTHIAAAREIQTRHFPLTALATQRTLRSAEELQLTDGQNTLRRGADGTLVARGHPAFVEMVAELARANDPTQPPVAGGAATGREDFRVYYLRYAWAQDVSMSVGGRSISVPGVASILRTLVGVPGGASQPASRERPSTVPGCVAKDWRPRPIRRAAHGAASAATGVDQRPPHRGRSTLNAIIVRDQPERLERYGALIQALDVEPQSLEIEATVIDVNTDRLRELGINWRWSSPGGSEFLFGNGTASDLNLRGGRDVTPIGKGGFISAVLGSRNNFVARINALQDDGAARVVSSPQVLTLSNVEAVFDSSSTFYVRVAAGSRWTCSTSRRAPRCG